MVLTASCQKMTKDKGEKRKDEYVFISSQFLAQGTVILLFKIESQAYTVTRHARNGIGIECFIGR